MIILETERLLFRGHTLEDLDPFCALEADPVVRRFAGRPPDARRGRAQVPEWLPEARPGPLGPLGHRFKPDGRYIGYCGAYPPFGEAGPIPGEGALAFTLAPAYWGRGLATEAARAFVDFQSYFSWGPGPETLARPLS